MFCLSFEFVIVITKTPKPVLHILNDHPGHPGGFFANLLRYANILIYNPLYFQKYIKIAFFIKIIFGNNVCLLRQQKKDIVIL